MFALYGGSRGNGNPRVLTRQLSTSPRLPDHRLRYDCDQDYVRPDLLETSIIQDIKTMFREEQFMARLREEANKRLGAEKPGLETEIARIDGQMVKTRAKTDRYFESFENGSMKPDIRSQKVKDLNATLEALAAEKRELQARRERLELPAIDREMLSRLVDMFEEVLAEGTTPQKKSTFSAIW